MNLHHFPDGKPIPDETERRKAAAEFHAREAIREYIDLYKRTGAEWKLSALFEEEAKRI